MSDQADAFAKADAVNGKFLADLVAALPMHRGLFEAHSVSLGELVPHLFMAEIAAWANGELARGTDLTSLDRLLAYLESSYPTANKWVQEMIVVSFLENIRSEFQPLLGKHLGPYLSEESDLNWGRRRR